MANFDLDDPLGDLLSDGSNDSFFEEPKTVAKRSSLTKTPEKKSVSELFGIEKSDTKAPADSKANWLGLGDDQKKAPEKPQKQASPKKIEKKISFEDDNILENLGLEGKNEPRKEGKSEASRKSSLVDSILKPAATTEEKISFDDILKASKFSKKPEKSPQVPMKAASIEFQANIQPVSTNVGQREGRRTQGLQSGFTDILGIFPSEPSKDSDKEFRKSTPSSPMRKSDVKNNDTRKISAMGDSEAVPTEVLFPAPGNREVRPKSVSNASSGLPNWLDGASSSVEMQKSELTLPEQNESKTSVPQTKASEFFEDSHGDVLKIDSQPDNFLLQSLINQQKLATQDMEYQNSTIAMQQQDSQLIMALQLKKYEQNLAIMQRKQQELLSKQEQHFNALLERQFAKQQIMENNMRMQQERINSHMQMLLSQTSMNDLGAGESVSNIENLKKSASDESVRLFDELLGSVKQRSQEEKFLLEESYKRQISTLEQTMESIESRLKTEIDYLHTTYANKFEQLKDNYEEEIQKYKTKIEEMSTIQATELGSIRENHDKIIEEIKYEYSTLIENIKQTKQSESQLFQNSAEYSRKLDAGIQMLDTNSRLLLGVREKVDSDYSVLSMAREESLKAREEEIKLMKQSLEKVRASAEDERSQLLALVRSLEVKLSEQTQAGREERWAMQQAAATLVARSAALDREAEFNRASIEREREQLKTLKETLLAEQETKTLQLTEEKLALSAERSRLETSTKLHQNYDAQRARAEIDAAIEVAQKAAELTDVERKNLQRAQCDVETLKRCLLDREHKLAMREKELETLMEMAEKKSKDGEQAIVRANATQRDYNERLKDIQNQLVSLSNREKRLAEEKVALSKERIALQAQMKQLKHSSLRMFEPVSHFDDDFPESI